MPHALLFLPSAFEETEAVVTIDILRRGGVSVQTVALSHEIMVESAHGICIKADLLFEQVPPDGVFDMLILPGGPGTKHYKNHQGLLQLIQKHAKRNKWLAAICAAPTIFGQLGLLDGKQAVCFPGMENGLGNAIFTDEPVVIDGHVVTAKAAGAAVAFGLALVTCLQGTEMAAKVAAELVL